MIPSDLAITADLPKGPWAADAYLRDAGFKILSRAKAAIWNRGDHEYTEAEAFAIAHREEPATKRRKAAERAAEDEAERCGTIGKRR